MSQRSQAFLSVIVGSLATLGALTASYGLVYPARAQQSKVPLCLALLAGAIVACSAGWLALTAHRRARRESERFLALLGVVLSAFFLFVIIFGFGIPDLVLQARD
jgi:hypothetical protein